MFVENRTTACRDIEGRCTLDKQKRLCNDIPLYACLTFILPKSICKEQTMEAQK